MLNPLSFISKIFKSSNQNAIDEIQHLLKKVNSLEKEISNLNDEDLFKFSYDYVGDLAETISLLWESNNKKNTKINLHEFMEIFSNFDHKISLRLNLNIF